MAKESEMAQVTGDATVRLVFEIPLNQCTIGKSTKGDTKGQQFWNLPYFWKGKFGKKDCYLKGGRVIIPVSNEQPVKQKADKPTAIPKELLNDVI